MIDISFCPLQCLSSNSDIRGRIKYDLHVLAKSESRFRIAERGNQRTIILFKKKERSMLLVRLKTHIFLIKQMCIFVMFHAYRYICCMFLYAACTFPSFKVNTAINSNYQKQRTIVFWWWDAFMSYLASLNFQSVYLFRGEIVQSTQIMIIWYLF